jgi:hypothetical protein
MKVRKAFAAGGILVPWWGLLLVAHFYLGGPEPAHASSNVRTLSPLRTFDVPADSDHRVEALVATAADLTFLVRGPQIATRNALVKTDFFGRLLERIDLPDLGMPPVAMRFHAQKGYAVLFRRPTGEARVLLLAGDGKVVKQITPGEPCFNIEFVGERLLGMSYSSMYVLAGPALPDGTSRIEHQRNTYYESAPITDTSVAMIELLEGNLTFVDLVSKMARTTSPSAPEIVRRASLANNIAPSAVFSRAVGARRNRIYVGVPGFHHRLSQGAVVLGLSSDGTVEESIRCLMPKFDNRYLTPDRLSLTDENLFCAWSQNRTVAVYPLP